MLLLSCCMGHAPRSPISVASLTPKNLRLLQLPETCLKHAHVSVLCLNGSWAKCFVVLHSTQGGLCTLRLL